MRQHFPEIKGKVCTLEKSSLEIEFEQLVIRANNRESRLLTDYIIVDRQLVIPKSSCRFDLTAIYLQRGAWHRAPHQVPLALLELKFGLNPDTGGLYEQLSAYYETVRSHIREIALETESILKQKLALELISHPTRTEAYRKLTVIPDIDTVRFGIVLIDYAPESELLQGCRTQQAPVRIDRSMFLTSASASGKPTRAPAQRRRHEAPHSSRQQPNRRIMRRIGVRRLANHHRCRDGPHRTRRDSVRSDGHTHPHRRRSTPASARIIRQRRSYSDSSPHLPRPPRSLRPRPIRPS